MNASGRGRRLGAEGIAVERTRRAPVPSPARRMDPSDFRAIMRHHPAGVGVITADAGAGPVGLTATSICSVSADPPLLVFSLSDSSSSTPGMLHADSVVIHLIGRRQLRLAKLFATSGVDRFADENLWRRLPTGEPYLVGVDTRIRARLVEWIKAGTSTIGIACAIDGTIAERSQSPVVYHDRAWHVLGEHSLTVDEESLARP